MAQLIVRLKNGEVYRENLEIRQAQTKRAQLLRNQADGEEVVVGDTRINTLEIEATEIRA